jgi:hypothetical protein
MEKYKDDDTHAPNSITIDVAEETSTATTTKNDKVLLVDINNIHEISSCITPPLENEEYQNISVEDMCLICGEETTCICYEASMDEINAEDEVVYVSSLGPYARRDYENHKKMDEFLRIYCGK